jgi:hypothetical protein
MDISGVIILPNTLELTYSTNILSFVFPAQAVCKS